MNESNINNTDSFISEYSEDSFWDKINKFAQKAGVKVIYSALLLYYALQNPNIPTKIKTIILGALGYFISPIDVIPDIMPVVGYTDDFGVLLAALAIVAFYIDEESKQKAKAKIIDWFGEKSLDGIAEVDEKLS